MRTVFPALWVAPRGVWALLGLATLLALTAAVPAALGVLLAAAAFVFACAVADLALGPAAQMLRVVRDPLGYVALRRPVDVTYGLENRSRSALRVWLAEAPVRSLDFTDALLDASVAPNGRARIGTTMLARERGLTHFSTIYLAVENSIGFWRRRFALDAPEEVRVFPDLSAVESHGRLARRSTLLDAGLRKLKLRGAGTEFESLREYETGDAFRAIDWKASARRGRLMVAQFEVERSQQVLVALDAGRMMCPRLGAQRKFDYALTAGLSVARIAAGVGDQVGLVAFAGSERLHIAPRRGVAHHAALVRAAYDVQPTLEEPDYEAVCANISRRYPKRSLVVFFTDFFDPLAATTLLASLTSLVRRHLVMCVLMNDTAIAQALEQEPHSRHEAYVASVALSLGEERRVALAALRARGLLVVDVPAPRLTVSLLDAYLDVKLRALL